MKGTNQLFRKQFGQQQQIKQSESIMRQIGHIKQSVSPYLSNTKISDHQKEKWYQYLPKDNLANNNSLFNPARDEHRTDNYRQSLERRLEKLFKEEKQILKQRHYANSIVNSHQMRDRRSNTTILANSGKQMKTSNSIQRMERKIRKLEQRYRIQENKQKKQSILKNQQCYQNQIPDIAKEPKQFQIITQQRQPTHSTYPLSKEQDMQLQQSGSYNQKRDYLQHEVEQLKRSVKQLRDNNNQLLKRVEKKEEKRSHKHRTKELLQNILHKLQFINVEISNVKRRQSKSQNGTFDKVQKDAKNLIGQFEHLKVQYKNLEKDRKMVEERQTEIERRIKKITEEKEGKQK